MPAPKSQHEYLSAVRLEYLKADARRKECYTIHVTSEDIPLRWRQVIFTMMMTFGIIMILCLRRQAYQVFRKGKL